MCQNYEHHVNHVACKISCIRKLINKNYYKSIAIKRDSIYDLFLLLTTFTSKCIHLKSIYLQVSFLILGKC